MARRGSWTGLGCLQDTRDVEQRVSAHGTAGYVNASLEGTLLGGRPLGQLARGRRGRPSLGSNPYEAAQPRGLRAFFSCRECTHDEGRDVLGDARVRVGGSRRGSSRRGSLTLSAISESGPTPVVDFQSREGRDEYRAEGRRFFEGLTLQSGGYSRCHALKDSQNADAWQARRDTLVLADGVSSVRLHGVSPALLPGELTRRTAAELAKPDELDQALVNYMNSLGISVAPEDKLKWKVVRALLQSDCLGATTLVASVLETQGSEYPLLAHAQLEMDIACMQGSALAETPAEGVSRAGISPPLLGGQGVLDVSGPRTMGTSLRTVNIGDSQVLVLRQSGRPVRSLGQVSQQAGRGQPESLAQTRGTSKLADLSELGGYQIVWRSEPRQYFFNCPHQLAVMRQELAQIRAKAPTDALAQCVKYLVNVVFDLAVETRTPVQEGDLVIMASDGVFDNLFDEQIVDLVNREMRGDCEHVARALVQGAMQVASLGAQLPAEEQNIHKSPVSLQAWLTEGCVMIPGKPDDTTALVSVVRKRRQHPHMKKHYEDWLRQTALLTEQPTPTCYNPLSMCRPPALRRPSLLANHARAQRASTPVRSALQERAGLARPGTAHRAVWRSAASTDQLRPARGVSGDIPKGFAELAEKPRDRPQTATTQGTLASVQPVQSPKDSESSPKAESTPTESDASPKAADSPKADTTPTDAATPAEAKPATTSAKSSEVSDADVAAEGSSDVDGASEAAASEAAEPAADDAAQTKDAVADDAADDAAETPAKPAGTDSPKKNKKGKA